MLANDTTPEQKHDIKYQIIETDDISRQQRSWINSMLRKHLGDPKVANYILNHGLPGLLDLSLHEQIYSKAILQGMLEEFMSWHVAVLQSIVDHNNHPNMINAHRQSALKEERATANQTLRRGYAKEEQTKTTRKETKSCNGMHIRH